MEARCRVLWFLGDAAVQALDLAPAISTIGSLGISGWFVVHTMTKTIPNLQADHRSERKEIFERHDKQLEDQRKDLLLAVATARQDFLDDLREIRQSRQI